MSPERAAELVMQQDYWEICPARDCVSGWTMPHDPKRVSECARCTGYGNVLKAEVKEAYQVLGMAPPKRTGIYAYRIRRQDITERGMTAVIQHDEDKNFLQRVYEAIAEREGP